MRGSPATPKELKNLSGSFKDRHPFIEGGLFWSQPTRSDNKDPYGLSKWKVKGSGLDILTIFLPRRAGPSQLTVFKSENCSTTKFGC